MADKGMGIALLGILGVIISAYLYQTGAFTSADIRFVRQPYLDESCPTTLSEYSDFKISFTNSGNRGTDLFVELQSPDNISFIKQNDGINIPAGMDTTFSFKLNSSSLKSKQNYHELIDNATIKIIAKYEMNNFGKSNLLTQECKYKKSSSSLALSK